jgi:hypothetical protein
MLDDDFDKKSTLNYCDIRVDTKKSTLNYCDIRVDTW